MKLATFVKIGMVCLLFSLTYPHSVNAANGYQQGYYYDVNGQKVSGLINPFPSGKGILPGEGFILFKAAKDAEKQKLSASMIRSFVVGTDSFTVTHYHNPNLRSKNSIDFIQVLIDEPLKLYAGRAGTKTITPGVGLGVGNGVGVGGGISINLGSGGSNRYAYFYGTNPDMLTEINKQNWAEIMIEITAGQPQIAEKIRNKSYKFSDMNKLVADFNALPLH